MTERRFEDRLLCADIVEVEWTDNPGELRIANALLEDISPIGLCLQLDYMLPAGTAVTIRMKGRSIPASVQYCAWREIGYFTGLVFQTGFRWSSHLFRPQHLLNPAILQSNDAKPVV
ncbi:MAG: hypothetical protein M3Z09_06195 [Acidobacteriota bacterium]|nr:hypothetical protein [Acidobacteriota bacterium]